MKYILSIFIFLQFNNAIYAQTSITIYKDDRALIKQKILWELEQESNVISWDSLPSGLIDGSAFLNLTNARILTQRLNNNTFRFRENLKNKIGENIEIKLVNEREISGVLVEFDNSILSVQRRGSILSFNFDRVDYVSVYDEEIPKALKPTLTWSIAPKDDLEKIVNGNLIYLSKGFKWKTIYKLIINRMQNSADFVIEADIFNNSNMDFSEVNLKLIEGNLNTKVSSASFVGPYRQSRLIQNSFQQNQFGDYYIYNLNQKINLKSNESILARLYPPKNVSFKKTYLFENNEKNQREEPLMVEYTIPNIEENNIGIPLPEGNIQIYQYLNEQDIEFIGEDHLSQVTKGEEATITSGRAFDVIGKRSIINFDRQQKSEEASIMIEINNTLSNQINVRLVEEIRGDWVIRKASSNYQKKDATTIQFSISVPANRSKTVTYTYRKEL